MKKILKWTGVALVAAFILIQFIRPDRTNPVSDPANDYTRSLLVPPDVKSIVDRACRDCHTNETVWPWYSNFAPVSWLLADDVTEGRRHLNLSEWGKYTPKQKIKRLSDIDGEVSDGSMPLPNYLRIHSEAVLTQVERDKISHWADEEGRKLGGNDE
ncbi:MAG TPA: heme-binding domain-containing protein [Bacteroidota bacterium]|nr:heme-binding domain-containing protein [Bacteroidota bacterium]